MNDREITDFDKLKNTLIEIGVDFDIDEYWNEIVLVCGVRFVFRSNGKLCEVETQERYSDD